MRQDAAVRIEDARLGGDDLAPADDDARLGADASGVLVDGTGEIGFGLDGGDAEPAGSIECAAQPVALSIRVRTQPPCTVPRGLSRCGPVSPSKTA